MQMRANIVNKRAEEENGGGKLLVVSQSSDIFSTSFKHPEMPIDHERGPKINTLVSTEEPFAAPELGQTKVEAKKPKMLSLNVEDDDEEEAFQPFQKPPPKRNIQP